VLDVQIHELSPLENALNDVKTKTVELASLERRYQHFPVEGGDIRDYSASLDTNPLSMALNSAVDTGLAGGIPLYRRAFFESSFIGANTDKIDLVEELRIAIDEQIRTSE
jgi:dedicator of cytokinesis protein 3